MAQVWVHRLLAKFSDVVVDAVGREEKIIALMVDL
jgi:hypothetical protein